MADKIQPGGRIDPEVWEEFKNYVERKHGRTRGVLGEELEKALKNHYSGDRPTEPLHRIENDVAHMKRLVAEMHGEADGSGMVAEPPDPPSRSDLAHTHTDDDRTGDDDAFDALADATPAPDTKPGTKATRAAKAAWVFGELESGGALCVPPSVIEKKVDDAWSFGDRAKAGVIDAVWSNYHAEAVTKPDELWYVSLGKTPGDRDARFDEWSEDTNPDDVRVVPEERFDGFDANGNPKTV